MSKIVNSQFVQEIKTLLQSARAKVYQNINEIMTKNYFKNRQTVSSDFKLSYSHYIFLSRIKNEDERNFYEIEAIQNAWSL